MLGTMKGGDFPIIEEVFLGKGCAYSVSEGLVYSRVRDILDSLLVFDEQGNLEPTGSSVY